MVQEMSLCQCFSCSGSVLWTLNSLRSDDVYSCQWVVSLLFQVMVWHPFGTKPFPEAMLTYCQFDLWEQISMKFGSKYKTFHQEKAFENVCKTATILPRHQCVNVTIFSKCCIMHTQPPNWLLWAGIKDNKHQRPISQGVYELII